MTPPQYVFNTTIRETNYKAEFVKFIASREWHWFVTIGIGFCDDEEELLRKLRLIEAMLCGEYVSNSYNKLDDAERYSMAVAFEGENNCGTRHAHLLAYVPPPRKLYATQFRSIQTFPNEFLSLWNKMSPAHQNQHFIWPIEKHQIFRWENPDDIQPKFLTGPAHITFIRATTATKLYTVKNVSMSETNWSRFEFVTPP